MAKTIKTKKNANKAKPVKKGTVNKKLKASTGKEEKTKKIKNSVYEKELGDLQIELVKLQEWIKEKGLKVVCIFEGRDAAGKGHQAFSLMCPALIYSLHKPCSA